MDIKARLTQVQTWVWVGIVTVLGTVAKYSIENSKLPDWLSNLVDLVGLHFLPSVKAVFDVRLPVVVFLIAGVLIAITGYWVVRYFRGQLSVVTEKLRQLESENESLKKLEKAGSGSNTPRRVLDSSAPGAKEFDAALQAKFTALASHNLNVSALNEEQRSVFEFIGGAVDAGRKVTQQAVVRDLRVSLLTAEDILDTLCDMYFLERVGGMYDTVWYRLTKPGRSCYLELMRRGPVSPTTRHG